MDTDGTAAQLYTVAHEVVGFGTHLFRMLVEQRNIVGVGHRERMMSCHKALLFIAPLEQGEVDNPKTLELILIAQSQAVAHLQTEGAELDACLVGIVARENEHEIAILGTHFLLELSPNLGRIELVYAGLHGSVFIEFDVDQSFGSYLRTLHEVGKLVDLLARVVGTTRDADTADILCRVENGEGSRALQYVHQLHELHAEAQVGLIRTEATHRLMPRHLLQLGGKFYATNLFEQMTGHILEHLNNVFLVDERHLAVYLRELRLTVSTQVLIAEALGYLEIAVEAAHHQQLLQRLRRLRQGIELSGIHAAGHHEVACALGRGTYQNRRLHLDEVARVEKVTDEDGHLVTQLQVSSHALAAQVQITVLHTDVVAAVGLVLDGERRRQAFAQDVQILGQNLDVARGHLRVLALTLADGAFHLHAELAAEAVGLGTELGIGRLVEYNLCDTIAVANVDKRHAAHLTGALHPAGQRHFLTGILEPKLSTSISPIHRVDLRFTISS